MVDVGNMGSDLIVQTGGGGIHIDLQRAISPRRAVGKRRTGFRLAGCIAQTGGGSIHVDKCTGNLKVSTGEAAST